MIRETVLCSYHFTLYYTLLNCANYKITEHVWSSITTKPQKQPSRVLARKADTFVAAIAMNKCCEAVVTRTDEHFRWIKGISGS